MKWTSAERQNAENSLTSAKNADRACRRRGKRERSIPEYMIAVVEVNVNGMLRVRDMVVHKAYLSYKRFKKHKILCQSKMNLSN